jgi:hypothetical protein
MKHPMRLTRFFSIFQRTFSKNPRGNAVPTEEGGEGGFGDGLEAGGEHGSAGFCGVPLGAVLLSFRLQECRSHGRKVFIRHQFTRESQDSFSW